MAFDRLRPQPPRTPENTRHPERASWYGAEAVARSRRVAERLSPAMDVAYGRGSEQRLDLYPASRPGAPILVFFHGGAWAHGYKEWNGFMAAPLCDAPILFVSPDYRLVPEHKFPAALDDALAAVVWAYEHAREYGGDPARLFVGGWSAGGTLAGLIGLRHELHEAVGLPRGAVRGCVVTSSMFEIKASDPAPGNRGWTYRDFFVPREGDDRAASPLHHVRTGAPPFFVSHSDADFPQIVTGGPIMVEALRAAGVPVRHRVYSGPDHYQAHLDLGDPSHDWVKTVRTWLTTGALPD
ncbi:MAG: alpha/beta hydrolase [Alphaproteobacteria bacterium]|nr:alpha/beta hydrolase [Alphaproteobacteria bacterium]